MSETETLDEVRMYRISVLGTGLVRMWRGWWILLSVILANAVLQSLLVWLNPMPYLSFGFVALSVASLLILLLAWCIVASAMLQATTGKVEMQVIWKVIRTRWAPLLGWSLALLAALVLGFSLAVVPGLLISALFPFLLLAVVDGRSNPLATNFRVIAVRWGRWLITLVLMGFGGLVLWLLSGIDGFFVTGAPGALAGWIVLGFAASWYTAAWALVYRSVCPPQP